MTSVTILVLLSSTFGAFFGEALGTVSAWLLVALNVLVTTVLILGLTPLFKPRHVFLCAFTSVAREVALAVYAAAGRNAIKDLLGASGG